MRSLSSRCQADACGSLQAAVSCPFCLLSAGCSPDREDTTALYAHRSMNVFLCLLCGARSAHNRIRRIRGYLRDDEKRDVLWKGLYERHAG